LQISGGLRQTQQPAFQRLRLRREDMRKLLLATRGKLFVLKTIDRLVGCSRLREFAAILMQIGTRGSLRCRRNPSAEFGPGGWIEASTTYRNV
jgi:hypothetical protein